MEGKGRRNGGAESQLERKRYPAVRRYPTRNDLPSAVQAADVLNALLADSLDLVHQAKQAHWNAKGMQFFSLHSLFDQVAKEAWKASDLLAERVVQLGGVAEGGIRVAANRSRLLEYPHSMAEGREHVEAVASALAAFGTNVRNAIEEAGELDDPATVDILTEISRGADKQLWLVEAHLHG